MIEDFLNQNGVDYQSITDATGALRDLATEIDRRILAPYEDRKRIINGDIGLFQRFVPRPDRETPVAAPESGR